MRPCSGIRRGESTCLEPTARRLEILRRAAMRGLSICRPSSPRCASGPSRRMDGGWSSRLATLAPQDEGPLRVSPACRPRTPRRRSRPRPGSAAGGRHSSLVMTGITVTTGLPLRRRARPSRCDCLPSLIRLRVVGNGSLNRPLSPPASASRGDTQIESVGFLAVMRADLLRRRRGEEEPGVEALRHAFRRDPVRIGHQYIERQHHPVVGENFSERRSCPRTARRDGGLDLAGPLGIDQRRSTRAVAPAGCRFPRTSRGSPRSGKPSASASSPSPPA